jgi:hypothetical protein
MRMRMVAENGGDEEERRRRMMMMLETMTEAEAVKNSSNKNCSGLSP